MRLASPFLRKVVYPGLSRTGYLRLPVTGGPRVLTYHGILPEAYGSDQNIDGNLVTPEKFRQHLAFLKEHYQVICPEEFLAWCEKEHALPDRAVLLTCDDGLRNHLTCMLPILQEFDVSCLFFVTGQSLASSPAMLWHEELFLAIVGGNDSEVEIPEIGNVRLTTQSSKRDLWRSLVTRISSLPRDARAQILARIKAQLGDEPIDQCKQSNLRDRFHLLQVDELRQLLDAGMSIGAHTISHPRLSGLPRESAWQEISQIRNSLELALDRPIWAFAYPFGDLNSVSDRERKLAEDAGYSCAFLNVSADWVGQKSGFAIPRIHITGSMKMPEFEAQVSGFHRFLQRTFARAGVASAAG